MTGMHLPGALAPEDMQALLAVTRSLAAPLELGDLLNEVAAAARQILHAERASVWLLDEESQELVLEVASDLRQVRLPVGTGLIGSCA